MDFHSFESAEMQAVPAPFGTFQPGGSAEGWSTGGVSEGQGFRIKWQDGPLPKNGAFSEDIIIATRDRLAFFQTTNSANEFNARAIEYLNCALEELNARVADRQERGVYGTLAP